MLARAAKPASAPDMWYAEEQGEQETDERTPPGARERCAGRRHSARGLLDGAGQTSATRWS
jgi:hypothetical protein